MEDLWARAYRGDPGVPHTGPDRFVSMWTGTLAFSAVTWFNSQLSNRLKFNWHDKAMMLEHNNWKKLLEKRQLNISKPERRVCEQANNK